MIHHLLRFPLHPLFRVYFRMRGEGVEHVRRRRPFLLAPNHVSMLDWAMLLYFVRYQLRFLVDRSYYEHPLLGLGLRVNGAVPVRWGQPDLGAIRSALAVLRNGEPLVVFPEGEISLSGRPQRPQRGIIFLSVLARVPIVPVAIRGAFEAFPRRQRLPRAGHVTVVFGAPLPPPPGHPRGIARQELADRLMLHITALLEGTHPPAPW